jgi:hypothetical protein
MVLSHMAIIRVVQLYHETECWVYINYLQIVHRYMFKILLTLKSAQFTKTMKCTYNSWRPRIQYRIGNYVRAGIAQSVQLG